jgi:hypothetical protein
MNIDTPARLPFTLADRPSDTPLLEHPFSAWLIEAHSNGKTKGKGDLDLTLDWLESIGFNKEKHTIPKETLEHLKFCHMHVHVHWRRIANQHTFDELFELIDKPEDVTKFGHRDYITRNFPLYRNGKWVWVRFTDRMSSIVDTATFIFHVCPRNLSLNIDDNGVVSLRYQTILGSRLLATITDAA